MLKELLKRFDTKREIQIDTIEYGVYSERPTKAIFVDSENRYNRLSKKERKLNVSSVNSFIDFITEELKRLNNETGKKSTVVIDSEGGSFCADDDFKMISCLYSRSLTSGWETLQEVANSRLNHEDLLKVLQKFRPYIMDFEKLYSKLLDIRTIGRSEMLSNPVFINGEANSGYKIKFKLQSGETDETELPNQFELYLPYAKGRLDKRYFVPVELMFLNNGNGKIEILFQCPELERKEEEALQDEVEYLKEKLSDFKDLLVLLNL